MASGNVDLVRTLLWVIGILVAALGFFLTYYLMRTSQIMDKLSQEVQKLNLNFTGLNCQKKHEIIDNRLAEHGRTLDQHDRKIIELDTKINFR